MDSCEPVVLLQIEIVELRQPANVRQHALVDLEAGADPGDRPRREHRHDDELVRPVRERDRRRRLAAILRRPRASRRTGTASRQPAAERVGGDDAVEIHEHDRVGRDARAVIREHGGDRRHVGRGDRLAEREVERQHAQGVGELPRARVEDAIEHARRRRAAHSTTELRNVRCPAK